MAVEIYDSETLARAVEAAGCSTACTQEWKRAVAAEDDGAEISEHLVMGLSKEALKHIRTQQHKFQK